MAQSDVLKPYVPSIYPQQTTALLVQLPLAAPTDPDADGPDPAAVQEWANTNHRNIKNSIALLVQVMKQIDARLIAHSI